jgi:gamma-glutamylcyclotransferase (GGCT)/AIG2-like uncharacterized protein YtfP
MPMGETPPTDQSAERAAPPADAAARDVWLFAYGTLQLRAVQLSNFGRELDGQADALPGYALTYVAITDPEVIAVSGSDRHPIVAPSADPADAVDGTVFAITEDELAAADEYEVDDYARTLVTLRSGTRAWVYISADFVH